MSLPLYAKDYRGYIIKLKSNKMDLGQPDFYVEEIIDARANQEDIGIILVGGFNVKRAAKLKDGFKNAIQYYLDISLPKEEGKCPIVLRITEFKLSVKLLPFGEKAVADAIFEFYKKENSNYVKLYETRQTAERKAVLSDCNKYHEENIRKILENSFKAFIGSGLDIAKADRIEFDRNEMEKPIKVVVDDKKPERIPFYNYEWNKSGEIGIHYNFTWKGWMYRYKREIATGHYKTHTNTYSYDIGYFKTTDNDIDVKYSNVSTKTGKYSVEAFPVSLCINRKVKSGFWAGKWGIGLSGYYYDGTIDMRPYDAVFKNNGIGANVVIPGELIILSGKDKNLHIRIGWEWYIPLTKNKYNSTYSYIETMGLGGFFLGISFGGYW